MFDNLSRALARRGRPTPDGLSTRVSRRYFSFGFGAIAAAAAVYAGARSTIGTTNGSATGDEAAAAVGAPTSVSAPERPARPLGGNSQPATPQPTVGQPTLAATSTTVPDTATPQPSGQTDASAGPDGAATPEAGQPGSSSGSRSRFGQGGFRDQGTPLPLVGYAGATWIPSPYHRRRTQTIDTLVMHTTASTLQSAINEFQNSTRHVSAHYIVSRAGQIIQMVSENQVAFHAGVVTTGPDSRFYGTNPNAYSIGIEMENLDVITGPASFPQAQRDAVFKLAKDVVQRNHIPLDRQHIVAHSEIDPADRRDPGPGFPWSDFLAYLKG